MGVRIAKKRKTTTSGPTTECDLRKQSPERSRCHLPNLVDRRWHTCQSGWWLSTAPLAAQSAVRSRHSEQDIAQSSLCKVAARPNHPNWYARPVHWRWARMAVRSPEPRCKVARTIRLRHEQLRWRPALKRRENGLLGSASTTSLSRAYSMTSVSCSSEYFCNCRSTRIKDCIPSRESRASSLPRRQTQAVNGSLAAQGSAGDLAQLIDQEAVRLKLGEVLGIASAAELLPLNFRDSATK